MIARMIAIASLAACAASPTSPLAAELARARAAHRPVMIEVGAQWCAACRLLERGALADPAVVAELGRFAIEHVDATDDDTEARRLGATVLPTLVFVDAHGDPLPDRVMGDVPASTLLTRLRAIR